MKGEEIVIKLKLLTEQLHKLQTSGVEEMREKRISADMGDDYRENEGAKMVMEDESLLYIRIRNVKLEIGNLRKQLFSISRKGKKPTARVSRNGRTSRG